MQARASSDENFGEPYAETRTRLVELEVCPELQEKALDNADAVIHGT